MAMQDQDFWRRAADAVPGMLNTGIGLWGNRAARREAQGELNAAQGPEYQAAMAASQGALAKAGSMDPQAAAQARFDQAQGLLAGKDASDEAGMLRMLQSKGLLDVANFNPNVEGIAPGTTAMNPHMAAFYAARNARNGRMAYDSLNEGDAQIDRLLRRSANAQNQANAQRTGTLNARSTIPSQAAGTVNLLKGLTSIAKDTGLMKDLPGMLKGGYDWLGGKTGWWGGRGDGPEELTSFFGAHRLDGMDGI